MKNNKIKNLPIVPKGLPLYFGKAKVKEFRK
jgi:hypothetical protein